MIGMQPVTSMLTMAVSRLVFEVLVTYFRLQGRFGHYYLVVVRLPAKSHLKMFYMHENAKFLIFKFSKVMQQHT